MHFKRLRLRTFTYHANSIAIYRLTWFMFSILSLLAYCKLTCNKIRPHINTGPEISHQLVTYTLVYILYKQLIMVPLNGQCLPFKRAKGCSSTVFLVLYFDEPCDFFCLPLRREDFLPKGSILSTAGPADIMAQKTRDQVVERQMSPCVIFSSVRPGKIGKNCTDMHTGFVTTCANRGKSRPLFYASSAIKRFPMIST